MKIKPYRHAIEWDTSKRESNSLNLNQAEVSVNLFDAREKKHLIKWQNGNNNNNLIGKFPLVHGEKQKQNVYKNKIAPLACLLPPYKSDQYV